ncbi:MAG TPA: epimerase, partial [Saprospiraceae bacterium]|nr:epimerase [Saprospiraceae bacterium]
YIQDNLDFTLKILEDKLYINDVVNVGNDKIVTINELAESIIQLTGSKSKIVSLPPLKEGDMSRRQPDIEKMKMVLNRELTPLSEGLMKVISAY